LKNSTGFGEEQTVKVVGNGEGGPKRKWKAATWQFGKRTVKAASGSELQGSGFSELGAPKGQQTSREEGRDKGKAVVSRTGVAVGEAGEVLEGERKAMSDVPAGRETDRWSGRRKTPGSTPKGKRAKAEPRSRTNGYGGRTGAEG
jgi:hypothetical protein